MMSVVLDDIVVDFIFEVQEILDCFGEQLVLLEQLFQDMDQFNVVFCGFYIFKGGVGFFGIQVMVELCYVVEEIFGMVCFGQVILQVYYFDVGQQLLDYLQLMLDLVLVGIELGYVLLELIVQFDVNGLVMFVLVVVLVGNGELIIEDEFEVLLDQLYGGVVLMVVVKVVDGLIGEDEFEVLFDQLYGGVVFGVQFVVVVVVLVLCVFVVLVFVVVKLVVNKLVVEVEYMVCVDIKCLDVIVNLIGELVFLCNCFKILCVCLYDEELDCVVFILDIVIVCLQLVVMCICMQLVGKVFLCFFKVVCDVVCLFKKEVDLELVGVEIELDCNLVEVLVDFLVYLVWNVIDYGVEMFDLCEVQGKLCGGYVWLLVQQEGDYVSIEVQDDGVGIDFECLCVKVCEKGLIDFEVVVCLISEECLYLVFLLGFFIKQQVIDIFGCGVGMDVVQLCICELSGQIQIQFEFGCGSCFMICVLLILVILFILLVQVGEDVYVLLLVCVMEVFYVLNILLGWFDGCVVLDCKLYILLLVDLCYWLEVDLVFLFLFIIVVLQVGEVCFGLVVDQVWGCEEVVIKLLFKVLCGLCGYVGVILIGDGCMLLIFDVDGLC